MSLVRMLAVVVVLATGLGACDADGGGWGFRNLGKRDASTLDRQRSATR